MAHFAKLDKNNVVETVIVVHDNDTKNAWGVEDEAVGIAFCQSLYGKDTRWIQTSYNGNKRKRYAGIGHTYDEKLDAFIAPKPFASWILDKKTGDWKSPVVMPANDKKYKWVEKPPSGEWKVDE